MNCVCIMESSPWQDIVNGCVCEQWIRVLVSSEFVDGYVFSIFTHGRMFVDMMSTCCILTLSTV